MPGLSEHLRRSPPTLPTRSLHTLIERDNPSCWAKGCFVLFLLFWVLFALYMLFLHDFNPPPVKFEAEGTYFDTHPQQPPAPDSTGN